MFYSPSTLFVSTHFDSQIKLRNLFSFFVILFSLAGYLISVEPYHVTTHLLEHPSATSTIISANFTQEQAPKPFIYEDAFEISVKAIFGRVSIKRKFVRFDKLNAICVFFDLASLQSKISFSQLLSAQSYLVESCLSYEFLQLNVLSAKHHPPTA